MLERMAEATAPTAALPTSHTVLSSQHNTDGFSMFAPGFLLLFICQSRLICGANCPSTAAFRLVRPEKLVSRRTCIDDCHDSPCHATLSFAAVVMGYYIYGIETAHLHHRVCGCQHWEGGWEGGRTIGRCRS